jgi:hypothetical protein
MTGIKVWNPLGAPSERRCWRAIRAVSSVATLACGAAAFTHSSLGLCASSMQTITIEDPRPIDEALQVLQPKYGHVVTYEDPPYSYEGDLRDVTEANAKSPSHGVRTLIPVGGSVNVTVPASGSDTGTLDSALRQLLQSHAALQRGGHFRFQEKDGVFHVIPTEVRDRNGNWQTLVPLLDSRITLPNLPDANGAVMLNAICDAVSKASGVRVMVGLMPVNILLQHRGALEANNETARAVLLRALRLCSTSLSWSLLYDAGLKMYFLNIRLIDVATLSQTPAGGQGALFQR